MRPNETIPRVGHWEFQFTHPGRGATVSEHHPTRQYPFQFTHPGRGATANTIVLSVCNAVSIHAPREGCDSPACWICLAMVLFQFTHPGRGATNSANSNDNDNATVSIHAPREGCDRNGKHQWVSNSVSIHAPREGCDTISEGIQSLSLSFNSRTPGGVRRTIALQRSIAVSFNSRTPGGVRLITWTCNQVLSGVSIHAPREGCD